MIRSSSDRRAAGSAASTAMTTQLEFTARGARRASTGSETEIAAYPATATQKVGGKKAKEGEETEGEEKEGQREGRERERSGNKQARERCFVTGFSTLLPPDINHFSNFCL